MQLASHIATFRSLHTARPGFIMPNAWDVGSALLLAGAGFPAIATTSAGVAFSLGRQDYSSNQQQSVSKPRMFERIAEIVNSVRIPVNGDLEAGYGDTPQAVADTFRQAIAVGLAGANLEDKRPFSGSLYDAAEATERIQAAREGAGPDFVLTARCDALQLGLPLETAIQRANSFRAAGADCVFLPGTSAPDEVSQMLKEIDCPLNVVVGLSSDGTSAASLLELGVQRISTGGTFARAALGLLQRGALELKTRGTLDFAAGQLSHTACNALFTPRTSGH